jgi:hypothetical protein
VREPARCGVSMRVLAVLGAHAEQRALVRWALAAHARAPNATNLDTHYVLPPQGLWNAGLDPATSATPIPPRAASAPAIDTPSAPARRTQIANAPASLATLPELSATPKPPAAPSARLPALPARALLPQLRWANVGWLYHWGTKAYDFSAPRAPVAPALRELCVGVVRAVDWDAVFGGQPDDAEAWPADEPDWRAWATEYGARVVAGTRAR